MIYNVYQGGYTMNNVVISKWGNSLGLRIPSNIVKNLNLKEGETLIINEHKDSFSIKKKSINTVEDVLCDFYGKDIDEIMSMNIVDDQEEMYWGDDVGSEVIK